MASSGLNFYEFLQQWNSLQLCPGVRFLNGSFPVIDDCWHALHNVIICVSIIGMWKIALKHRLSYDNFAKVEVSQIKLTA